MRGTRCILVALGLLILAPGSRAQAPDLSRMDIVMRSVPDGPVARVAGQSIPKQDYISYYQGELAQQMMRAGTPNLPDEVRISCGVAALTQLIQREILRQGATAAKLTVSQDEMDKRWASELESIKRRIPHAKDKELSEADILKMGGSTKQQAMEELRHGLLIDKFTQQLSKQKNITVSDAEIAQFYEKQRERFKRPGTVHFLQIFVGTGDPRKGAPDPARKTEARARIETALKRVRAGESFEAVAKAVSEAPDKDRGGDMGNQPTSVLPPAFVEAASKLKPGEVSEIMETPMGFHLVKFMGATTAEDVPLDKASPSIRNILMAEKTSLVVADYCKPLMDKPDFVQVFLDLKKSIKGNPELMQRMSTESAGTATTKEKPTSDPKKNAADAGVKKKKNKN